MLHKKSLPSQALLHQLFDYNPLTGDFIHRLRDSANFNCRFANKTAMNLAITGYFRITIDGLGTFVAHRLAWMYVYGIDPGHLEIDHKNQNRSDNRIENLRLVTRSEQGFNKSRFKTSRGGKPLLSPHRGVLLQSNGRWRSYVNKEGKRISLGTSNSLEEAIMKRINAAKSIQGEFYPEEGNI